MAENTTFPGTLMEVVTKYTDSYRLDHPDFGDVYKTTYAKGVITDFVKLSEDPFLVFPWVKVKVEGVNSPDYTPLFFHPKPKYWDGPRGPIIDPATGVRVGWGVEAYDATEFEETTGSFRKAWMGFRGDDEVVVMLQEGNPVAVLGFADGVPRIGEDIVRIEGKQVVWVRMSKAEDYADEGKGPDGLDLKLELEAEVINELIEKPYYQGIRAVLSFIGTFWCDVVTTNGNNGYGSTVTEAHYTNNKQDWTDEYLYAGVKHKLYLVKVGPILYLIETNHIGDYSTKTKDFSPDVVREYFDTGYEFTDFWGQQHDTLGEVAAAHDALMAVSSASQNEPSQFNDFKPIDLSEHDESGIAFAVYATLYSEELYNSLKSNPPSWNNGQLIVPEGFITQVGLEIYLDYLFTTKDFRVKSSDNGVRFFTRPHTKAELQAAGMWPAA